MKENKYAIEVDGLYWHSELNGKDKNYHLNKTLECEKQGIQLIHIFEDEWLYKKQIVKSRLKHILGKINYKIAGRKCIIKEISPALKNKFLDKYHLQGADKSKVKLGAFYKNRLVAVMTFGKPRFNKNYDFELVRFCTVGNFVIQGIAGKLFKHFERLYPNQKLISYADRRWSQGGLYKALGFELKHISKPNFFIMKNYSTRISRNQFQKHKLKDVLNNFNEELTAWENLQLNGFDRIWDCGNYVFEKQT